MRNKYIGFPLDNMSNNKEHQRMVIQYSSPNNWYKICLLRENKGSSVLIIYPNIQM